MKKIILLLSLTCSLFYANAQNLNAPTEAQMNEWHRIAKAEGEKAMISSTITNFFRNKIIFLIIGGAIVIVGGAISKNSNEDNYSHFYSNTWNQRMESKYSLRITKFKNWMDQTIHKRCWIYRCASIDGINVWDL